MKKYIGIKLLLCLLVSLNVAANSSMHSLYGEVISIDKPNVVTVKLDGTRHLLSVFVEDVSLEGLEGQDCQSADRSNELCLKLAAMVKDKKVEIIVTGKTSDPEGVKGDLIRQGKSISRHMILQGWFRMDWRNTRTKHLILAEKEARCHYRGIWQRYLGDPRIATDCKGV